MERVDRIAQAILFHQLNIWGRCKCGVAPLVRELWDDKTHARHVAEAIDTLL